MKYKIFILIILQSFFMISCKKRNIYDNTTTPNQLEQEVKNEELKYNISGENVLKSESEERGSEQVEEILYNKDQSTENDDYISNSDNDFKYSEFWRKEAYKASKQFVRNLLGKQNCNVISFSYFQPNLVHYIGNQGYRVRIRCTFEYQNYEHRKYFWIETYYYGKNKWDVILIDQKYDD